MSSLKSEPIELERLDELMKTVGKKIVQGIAISIARDEVYDTQPLEDWLKEQTLEWMKSLVEGVKKQAITIPDYETRTNPKYVPLACIDDILTILESEKR